MTVEKHPRGPLDRVANPLVGFEQVMENFHTQAGRVFGFDRLWVLQVGPDGAIGAGRHWGAGPGELLPDFAGPLAEFHRAHRRLPAAPVVAGPADPELGRLARFAGGGSVLLVRLRMRGVHRFLYADLGIAADQRLLVVVGGLPESGLAPELAQALTLCVQQSFNLAYVGTGLFWTGNLATGLFQLSPYGMVRKNPGPGFVFNQRAGLIAGLPAGGSGSVRSFEDLFPEAEAAGLIRLIGEVERRERDGGELEFSHSVEGELHLVRAKVTFLDLGPDEEEWAGARSEEQGNYWVVVGLEDITERVRRQRLDRELELAQSVQAQLMPDELPRLAGVELAVYSASASEMNGDFIDLIEQPDGALVIAVGDVSGHGIPAGIVMGLAKSALHTALLAEPDPGRIMQLMNTVLTRLSTRRRFVTLALARLEPATGRLSLASAGHPPVVVYSARTGRTRFIELVALPLGLRADLEIPRAETRLEPGDLALFYSDGIVEALDERERVFGYDRLRRLVRRMAGESAAAVRGALAEALDRYRGDRPRDDDQTLVVVKMRG